MILIRDGWAACYKQLRDGRRQIVSFLILGDASVYLLGEMDHGVAAITAVRYAEIAAADFERMKAESPALARAFWRHELITAAINREWIVNVGQRDARERIAHLMCELFHKLEQAGRTEGNGCDWPLTQTDLAEATGLTPVHVNRTLQVMRGEGLIEQRGRRLAIPDLSVLRRVAHFNPNYLHPAADEADRGT